MRRADDDEQTFSIDHYIDAMEMSVWKRWNSTFLGKTKYYWYNIGCLYDQIIAKETFYSLMSNVILNSVYVLIVQKVWGLSFLGNPFCKFIYLILANKKAIKHLTRRISLVFYKWIENQMKSEYLVDRKFCRADYFATFSVKYFLFR